MKHCNKIGVNEKKTWMMVCIHGWWFESEAYVQNGKFGCFQWNNCRTCNHPWTLTCWWFSHSYKVWGNSIGIESSKNPRFQRLWDEDKRCVTICDACEFGSTFLYHPSPPPWSFSVLVGEGNDWHIAFNISRPLLSCFLIGECQWHLFTLLSMV